MSYYHNTQKSVKYPFKSKQFMSYKSAKANIFLFAVSTIIILMAIAISAVAVSNSGKSSFSQVINVGPVWDTNEWTCTSDSEYIVHGALISYGNSTSTLSIYVSGSGTQPDFEFTPLKMESFSVGGPAGSTMRIFSTVGTITGFLTLQTMSDAEASCIPS